MTLSSMHSCLPSWLMLILPNTLRQSSRIFYLSGTLRICSTYPECKILLKVVTAPLPRSGSMPKSLNVKFENASSKWIRYLPSSFLSDTEFLEWPMNDSIMHSAHLDTTILRQPSSFTLSFSKVHATASLTFRTSSSRSPYSIGNA